MGILENILTQQIVQKLGWTLLHSIWQGGVIALLLVVLFWILRKSSANLRYVTACLGLAVIVLLPVVTFYVVPAPAPTPDVEAIPGFSAPVIERPYKVYDTDMPLQRAAEYMQIPLAISWKQRAKNLCTYALPFVVFGWFVGVFALSLWYFGGWVHLQRLRRKNVNRVDSSLKDKLHSLAGRLKVTRPVVLMESALVQIPTVVGWLRPLILMPVSALAGLSPGQLEALLAHELAHIRRYDYLVNMLQTVVEIVGFYHPAVWWVSHKIRVERENCCDDLAVSVCGDKVGYARALTSMEEARFAKGKLAVASSGGSLSRRIRRLIGTGSTENKRLGYLPVVVSVLLIMALTIPTTLAITAKRENRDSSPNRTIETGSIKATDAYVTATGQKNDYDPKYPAADSVKTANKAQILFVCEIYEVPADLKFIEDEQRKGMSGPIMKLLEPLKSEREKGSAGISIQLGKEYADSLKALSRENEYVKVLAAPRLITLDGKEATVNTTQNVSYTADYETDKGDDKPKPIIKNLPCEMELKVKGEVAKNNTIFTHLRLTQSKPVFATKQDDEGREIQIPIIERSDCTTYLDTRSGESIILGGLRSDEGPSRNLILVITPSIIRPEKGPEKAKNEKEIRAVAYDPEHVIVFPETEKGNIIVETRRPEQDKVMLEQQARTLEHKAAELYQLQKDIQRQLEDLEQRKAELESLSNMLASAKEARSDEEPRYHTVREGDSVAVRPASHLPGIDTQTQILFDCIIYELPADLEIIEDRQEEKSLKGRNVWLGNEYAERLESLCKTKKAKLLANPRLLVLEGEEGNISVGSEIPYKAGYESTTEVGTGPKPIVKFTFDGIDLKLKGHTADSSTIRTEIRLTQSKTSLSTHKDNQEREIQVPVVASSVCHTDVTVPSQTPVVIGGLKSQDNDDSQLLLVITPSIVHPEKGIESQIAIAKERRTIDDDPARVVDFPDAEKQKIKADQRLAELQSLLIQEQDRKIALEDQALELQQMLRDAQMKLAELETRKAELSELNKLSSELASAKEAENGKEPRYHTVREGETLSSISKKYYGYEDKWQEILNYNREIITADEIRVGQRLVIPPLQASAKEPETEHERLAAMAAKFAERGDFAKAIEHLENAIELAKAEKYYGIGIAIEKVDGMIRIGQLLPDAPASGSSFRQGDIIKAIDGVSTEGMSLNEVVAAIRGPKGTKVTLTVKCHSQDITTEETFTRQLLLKGSSALEEYKQRLAEYNAGKTWPQYRKMMEEQKIQNAGATRIFVIRYANVKELAEVLGRILKRGWKDVKDRSIQAVRIISEPNRNRLIVTASPADIRLIEALITELDVLAKQENTILKALPDTEYKQTPAADSTITRVIKLKYADCKDLEQILLQLLSDKRLRIATDKRTNMLIVTGTESVIQEITDLVTELDIPSREDITATKTSPSSKLTPDSPAEHVFYEIIQLKYSDCERMSEKVAEILSADQQFQLVPFKEANQLIIFGSKSAIQQVKALAKEIDVPGSKKELEIQY